MKMSKIRADEIVGNTGNGNVQLRSNRASKYRVICRLFPPRHQIRLGYLSGINLHNSGEYRPGPRFVTLQ